MNLINDFSSAFKGIILITIIMLISSCAYQKVRALNHIYIEHRNNAGWALKDGDCEKAESEMLEAVDISKAIRDSLPNKKGAGHNLAEAYKLLGHIYSDDNCKKYQEALDAYNKSKELKEHIYGINDPLYAHILNDIAWHYHYKQKEYDISETLLLRAKVIYEQNIENFYLQMVYTNLGEVYQAQSRYDEADIMLAKMSEIVNGLLVSRKIDPVIGRYKLGIYASFLREQGRNEEAEVIENKINENKKLH